MHTAWSYGGIFFRWGFCLSNDPNLRQIDKNVASRGLNVGKKNFFFCFILFFNEQIIWMDDYLVSTWKMFRVISEVGNSNWHLTFHPVGSQDLKNDRRLTSAGTSVGKRLEHSLPHQWWVYKIVCLLWKAIRPLLKSGGGGALPLPLSNTAPRWPTMNESLPWWNMSMKAHRRCSQ